MLTTSDILLGLVLPALVMVCAVWFARSVWPDRGFVSIARRSRLAFNFGATVAFIVGWGFLFGGLTSFPPLLATDRVLFILPAVACFGFLDALVKLPSSARLGAVMLLSGAGAWVVLRPLVDARTVAPSQGATAMTAVTLVCVVWWASIELLERRGHRQRSPGPPAVANPLTSAGVLLVLTVATAIVLMLSGSQSLGQKAGLLGTAMTGAVLCLVLFTRRDSRPSNARTPSSHWSLAHGATFTVVIGVVLLLASGVFYVVPGVWWLNVMLLASVPLFPWLAEVPFIRRRTDERPMRVSVVRISLSAIPAVVAVGVAVIKFLKALSDNPYPGY